MLSFWNYSRVALVIWKLSQRFCLTNLKPKENTLFSFLVLLFPNKIPFALTNKETWSLHGQEAMNGRRGAGAVQSTLSECWATCWPWHCRVLCCCFIFHMKMKTKIKAISTYKDFRNLKSSLQCLSPKLWWEHLHCANHSSANKLNICSTHLWNCGTMLPVWQLGSDISLQEQQLSLWLIKQELCVWLGLR